MLCAAVAAVGPGRSSWWAVWDRRRGILAEHTRLLGRALVHFGEGGRVRVADRGAWIDITVDEGGGVESLNAHGSQYVWTRKQAARPVRGRARDRAPRPRDRDDTAGYHARETEWWWSAGVGRAADGTPVGWNVVSGVNDGPSASERSIWSGGRAREVGPVVFGPDLDAVAFREGGELTFAAEAVRLRHDSVLVVSTDYRQPFGRFAGTLPGVGPVDSAWGVMEHHIARW